MADFTPAGFSGDHNDLENVQSDQHHTKPTNIVKGETGNERIEYGTVSLTQISSSSATVTVSFAQAFSSTPHGNYSITNVSNGDGVWAPGFNFGQGHSNISTTDFTLGFTETRQSNTAPNFSASWKVIGE